MTIIGSARDSTPEADIGVIKTNEKSAMKSEITIKKERVFLGKTSSFSLFFCTYRIDSINGNS
jgi:hypothetical protein